MTTDAPNHVPPESASASPSPDAGQQPSSGGLRGELILLADKVLSDWRATCRLLIILIVIVGLAVVAMLVIQVEFTLGSGQDHGVK